MAKTVSIRRSLTINLILVVALLGFGIIIMMGLSTRRAVQNLSASLIRQASRRTEVKLQGFFVPVDRQVEAMRMWGKSDLLDLDDPDGVLSLLAPLMRGFSWSSASFVASDQGREYLLRQEGDGWSSRQIWRDQWGDRAVFRRWADGATETAESEETIDYDPRTRPWYQGATTSLKQEAQGTGTPEVFWTEPYRFYSTGKPGITASTAFRDGEGRLHAVGIDISLTEISNFTSQIHLLEDSTVFVVTEDGRMIGVPRPPREVLPDRDLESLLLKRPEELGTTAAQDAADLLIDNPSSWGKPLRIVSDGEAWWGQVTPYRLSSRQTLLIGVAVGESAILGQIHQQRLWVAGITLIVLLLAVWRAARLARGYSRPVEELVQESERIATGDLEPGPPIPTRLTEIQQLAVAHDKMRGGLKTLLKLERDLQVARQIQQNTFPQNLPELPGIDLSAWNQPADETGGDSYDVIGLHRDEGGGGWTLADSNTTAAVLMLADATGHGIGPALSVTQLRAMLRMAVRLNADLRQVATNINQQLKADLPAGRFITAWFGLLDTSTYQLHTFSAGQAPLLRYRAESDQFDILNSDAVPLGLFPTLEVKLPDPIELAPGDMFLVMSDGFFEAKRSDDEDQGTERICEVVRRHRNATAAQIEQHIRAATDAFTGGAPLDDDRTILVLKRL